MDVILHVGAHRTATTTFQHHMASNRRELAAHGAVYWGPKVARGGLFRGVIGSADPILPRQQGRFAKRCAMRAEAVRETGASHLILSDENMLGSLRANLEDTLLYADAGHRIAAHASGFSRHRVTIGLCVRSYASWWTSSMAFRLSRGGPLPRTEMRERLVTQPRRWRHIIEEIARALPDATLMVWTFEALATQPFRVLEELCGLPTPEAKAADKNASPTADALRRLMADCDIDGDEFTWPDGHFMPFAPHEVAALDAQYDEDLAWLANGAAGLADYIDAPSAQTEELTDDGRGHPDDGDNRYLA